MPYIRFLNYNTSSGDIEEKYNDGDIQFGDIVCLQYNDKYSHIFMNGTWVRTMYNSKIKDNNEIEDDIQLLSTSIGKNTSNIDDISTRLFNDYIDKTLYVKDESLIAGAVAELNNKINNIEPILSDVLNLNSSVREVSNILHTLTETENINNTIDTFKEVEKFLNNISDSSTLTELLIKTKEDIISDISTHYYNIEKIDEKLLDINTSITNTNDNLNDISTRLFNDYIDKILYVKDESLIAGAVAELNNKINSLYAEITELKELIKNNTTE